LSVRKDSNTKFKSIYERNINKARILRIYLGGKVLNSPQRRRGHRATPHPPNKKFHHEGHEEHEAPLPIHTGRKYFIKIK